MTFDFGGDTKVSPGRYQRLFYLCGVEVWRGGWWNYLLPTLSPRIALTPRAIGIAIYVAVSESNYFFSRGDPSGGATSAGLTQFTLKGPSP
jgi:hypothetical protein